MTLKQAKELLAVPAGFGGFSAGSAKPILAETNRKPGQTAVDRLIRELGLERVFGFAPRTRVEYKLVIKPNQLQRCGSFPWRQQENPNRARGSVANPLGESLHV